MDQESENNRKRPRDDSYRDSPESKLARVESCGDSPDLGESHLDSDNSSVNSCKDVHNLIDSNGSGLNSPDAKRIHDDLLNILDEWDDQTIQGLDSVIRSFEEEILVPVVGPETTNVECYGGVSQPELGYLLEASDDELGLPPTFSGEEKRSTVDLAAETSGSGAEGGLFNHSDENYPSAGDTAGVQWQAESLSAL
ncbi:hypothetical protein GH714_018147 [Hevea brasiliensis]|uniref:Uncharacterized protein n=1 Tax=Hevea brasiliensis TaxID=3981 RepID=A0A6A6NI65_HEVBR|nr:hypothetical protein GH714_018147 [Hevea brasiliensis]